MSRRVQLTNGVKYRDFPRQNPFLFLLQFCFMSCYIWHLNGQGVLNINSTYVIILVVMAENVKVMVEKNIWKMKYHQSFKMIWYMNLNSFSFRNYIEFYYWKGANVLGCSTVERVPHKLSRCIIYLF